MFFTKLACQCAAVVACWCLAAGSAGAQTSWGNWNGAANPAYASWGTSYAWNAGNGIATSGINTDWKLGVNARNTEVGAYVDSVEPNSSAMRAGVNVGDTIICVANNAVGQSGNQIFDLGQTLNREADSYGRVRLLYLSGLTRQLRSVQVQLDRNLGGASNLSGTIVFQGNALPQDTIINVEVENVTRPHFVVRNGSISFRPSFNFQRDIRFSIPCDPRYIMPGDSYRVRATASSMGRITHYSEQQPFVLTQGNPSNVVLTMVPYAATSLPNFTTVGYPGYNSPIEQQVNAAYQRYLGRLPTPVELAVWTSLTNGRMQAGDVQAEILGSQEYFDRIGNNNIAWIQQIYLDILNRTPSSDELNSWLRRFEEVGYSRTELLRQLKLASGR